MTDAPRVSEERLAYLRDLYPWGEPLVPNDCLTNEGQVIRELLTHIDALRTPAQAAGVTVGEDRLAHLIHAFDVMQTCSPFLTTEAAHETRDLLRELQRLRSQPPAAQVCNFTLPSQRQEAEAIVAEALDCSSRDVAPSLGEEEREALEAGASRLLNDYKNGDGVVGDDRRAATLRSLAQRADKGK